MFENEVYEQQRKNILKIIKENPDSLLAQIQNGVEPREMVGFAPLDGICIFCGKDITKGEKALTTESIGDWIILGCPYCFKSFV